MTCYEIAKEEVSAENRFPAKLILTKKVNRLGNQKIWIPAKDRDIRVSNTTGKKHTGSFEKFALSKLI